MLKKKIRHVPMRLFLDEKNKRYYYLDFQGVKIQFHCEIYSEAKELLTTAEFLLVFVDIASGKPCVPNDEIKSILEHLSV